MMRVQYCMTTPPCQINADRLATKSSSTQLRKSPAEISEKIYKGKAETNHVETFHARS